MKVRVILADDHAIVREGLRAMLDAQSDMEVIASVADGRAALKEAQELNPDVVIMDVAMPKLNGIDATERLQRSVPKVSIIVLSMHGTPEHIYRAFKAGARGYLLKESTGWEVVEAIRAVCAGRRYLSGKIASEVDWQGAKDQGSPWERLSAREREILLLVVDGHSSAEIGRLLSLSPKTVDSYRSRLMQKLGIGDVTGLVKFAIRFGLTDLK